MLEFLNSSESRKLSSAYLVTEDANTHRNIMRTDGKPPKEPKCMNFLNKTYVYTVF